MEYNYSFALGVGRVTGKFVVVVGPQYLRAARSYALAAFSSLSYPPVYVSI